MPEPFIELSPGADNNGFATMLADLLRQNMEDKPHKRRDFRRLVGRVAIVVEDIQVAVTLHFQSGRLTVHDGIVGIPDLTIRADSDEVTRMSLVELLPRVGLPDPRGKATRAVFAASRHGRIRMYGLLANLPLVLRLTRLMSIN